LARDLLRFKFSITIYFSITFNRRITQMNKFSKAAMLMAGLAFGAHAATSGLAGVGYDTDLKEVTARIALGANAVDVGFGMKLNTDDAVSSDEKFQMSLSGFFLGHLHDWGPVDTYFTAGGVFAKLPQKNDNIQVNAFVGFQPEVTLLDHIAVSTRFGLDIPLTPNFQIQTAGAGISIVNGANFKILF
jgi:hypothetical protein